MARRDHDREEGFVYRQGKAVYRGVKSGLYHSTLGMLGFLYPSKWVETAKGLKFAVQHPLLTGSFLWADFRGRPVEFLAEAVSGYYTGAFVFKYAAMSVRALSNGSKTIATTASTLSKTQPALRVLGNGAGEVKVLLSYFQSIQTWTNVEALKAVGKLAELKSLLREAGLYAGEIKGAVKSISHHLAKFKDLTKTPSLFSVPKTNVVGKVSGRLSTVANSATKILNILEPVEKASHGLSRVAGAMAVVDAAVVNNAPAVAAPAQAPTPPVQGIADGNNSNEYCSDSEYSYSSSDSDEVVADGSNSNEYYSDSDGADADIAGEVVVAHEEAVFEEDVPVEGIADGALVVDEEVEGNDAFVNNVPVAAAPVQAPALFRIPRVDQRRGHRPTVNDLLEIALAVKEQGGGRREQLAAQQANRPNIYRSFN